MLSIKEVSKHFGGLIALKNVSFNIEENRIHGIIGPNGSGKTTIFNCISGLLPVTSGNIFLDDLNITEKPAYEISKLGIRRTFQGADLVPSMTVVENVMSGIYNPQKSDIIQTFFRKPFKKSDSEKELYNKAVETLKIFNINDSAERWGSELVWAERQLVQIARAVISMPKVLLLDEPAAGLGNNETKQIGTIIKKIRDIGITPVVVSHDMKMLMDTADYITVLNFGEKIFEGSPEQAMKDSRVLEAYLGKE
ncbi:MAG: ABC transporter ATP-binding protein [Spirochaetales bacterium]|nr:ABC transporter ATP-binding protein [Spirochaetales bacterium]